MANEKRKTMAELAYALRQQLLVGDDIELVVVICSSDGQFVGVSSSVPLERTEAILLAAGKPNNGRIEHPL